MALIPHQLLVLKRLTTLLEATPGYDLKGRVYRGRQTFGEEAPVPSLSIIEGTPDPAPDYANETLQKNAWLVLLQGWIESTSDLYPTDAVYTFKAAIQMQLANISARKPGSPSPLDPDNYWLGKDSSGAYLIADLKIGLGFVSGARQDQLASALPFFYLPLAIDLAYDSTNPYREES